MKVIDALQSLKNVDLVRFHTEAQESVCRAHEFWECATHTPNIAVKTCITNYLCAGVLSGSGLSSSVQSEISTTCMAEW